MSEHSETESYNNPVASSSSKKRRKSVSSMHTLATNGSSPAATVAVPPGHIPKRGARACTNCRRGKNRCEGESPCRRCQLSGQACIFAKPEKRQSPQSQGGERVSRLEGQYMVMQSQMIGMQSTLERILGALQSGPVPAHRLEADKLSATFSSNSAGPAPKQQQQRSFPPLPGFAPPPHKYATYGIVPSTAPSSDDESEDTLPRASMNAPIEALQGLANAAAEAAAAGGATTTAQRKKRRRVEPIPRNAFPHVLEKGLVAEQEAKELYLLFFSGCHLFIPLFDPSYDTFEGLKERTPFCLDAILAVASKIRSGAGPPSATFYKCLEEAQGIARSTLFGPVVRKEAVQAMLLLSAWSTSGWLPSGHAMRMALDLGLHRALEKLAEGDAHSKKRTEDEERDLVVSARIWLCLYWFDHQMSLGTGRPIVLRDESSIRHCRILIKHPMMSPTDVRLVSLVELIGQKTHIYDTLSPLSPDQALTSSSHAFIRRAASALDKWFQECDALHADFGVEESSLLRRVLACELHYAKLWLVCLALRGASWGDKDRMPFEQRELAFQAKDSASSCLATFLESPAYRAALRYSVHDSLVTAAFSGLFLLKVAHLFPAELDLAAIIEQVEQLVQLLSEVAAERYALTLRVMIASLRRKIGISTAAAAAAAAATVQPLEYPPPIVPSNYTAPPPLPIELLDMWPSDGGTAAIPIWLQEQSLSDLSLPTNGSDGIFLQMNGPSGWNDDLFGSMPEAW